MGTLIADLIAFAVVVWVLYKYVLPLVRSMIAARQEVVSQQVADSEEADRLLAEAQRRFDEVEAEAHDEAAQIRDDARADSTRIREELTEQAHQEVARIKQRGQEQLVAQRDQVARGLRAELGGQSMQLAERVVRDLLTDDRRRSATVDSFLHELEALPTRSNAEVINTGANGGAN